MKNLFAQLAAANPQAALAFALEILEQNDSFLSLSEYGATPALASSCFLAAAADSRSELAERFFSKTAWICSFSDLAEDEASCALAYAKTLAAAMGKAALKGWSHRAHSYTECAELLSDPPLEIASGWIASGALRFDPDDLFDAVAKRPEILCDQTFGPLSAMLCSPSMRLEKLAACVPAKDFGRLLDRKAELFGYACSCPDALDALEIAAGCEPCPAPSETAASCLDHLAKASAALRASRPEAPEDNPWLFNFFWAADPLSPLWQTEPAKGSLEAFLAQTGHDPIEPASCKSSGSSGARIPVIEWRLGGSFFRADPALGDELRGRVSFADLAALDPRSPFAAWASAGALSCPERKRLALLSAFQTPGACAEEIARAKSLLEADKIAGIVPAAPCRERPKL